MNECGLAIGVCLALSLVPVFVLAWILSEEVK